MTTSRTAGSLGASASPGIPEWRRLHGRRRVSKEEPLVVELGGAGTALAVDISEEGIGVDSSRLPQTGQPPLLRPGAVHRVRFQTPPVRLPFEASGMVVWVNRRGRAGIQFVNVPEPTRDQLKQWLTLQPGSSSEAHSPGVPPAVPHTATSAAAEEEADIDSALSLAVERARSIARASGAAIALGNNSGLVCRASSGTAPEVGVPVDPGSGLSGECIRTQHMIYCEDASQDPRVDPVVCQQLDLRSALVVPMFTNEALSGLLEVFSPAAHAFDRRCIERLQTLAQMLAAILAEIALGDGPTEPQQRTENSAVSEALPPAPPSTPRPEDVEAATPSPKLPEVPEPMPPAEPLPNFSAVMGDDVEVCDACGEINRKFANVCKKCDVPLPSSLEISGEMSWRATESQSFTSLGLNEQQAEGSRANGLSRGIRRWLRPPGRK